jgi:hypothetical protein
MRVHKNTPDTHVQLETTPKSEEDRVVNVKGSALRARLRYVAERGGSDGEARLKERLSPALRELCARGILANGWYPFAAFVELNSAIDAQLGRGDLALCYELGRYACDVNLTTLYRIFFRVGSVPFIIRRAAAAWRVNYDEGAMSVVEQSAGGAILRVSGVAQPHRAHCLSVRGWIVRAAEISGGDVYEQVERCRLLGDPECEYGLKWRKRE